MPAPWRIELLGGLRVQHDDRIITRFQKQKAGALLAYLAYHGEHSHPRDALVDVLWPDADPETGRNHLRNILYTLRHQLEPDGTRAGALVTTYRDTIGLNPAAFTTDVADYRAALLAARRTGSPDRRVSELVRAVEIYRGELLPDALESWVLAEREHLAEEYQAAVHQLAIAFEQSGELERAREYARRAVHADPLREEAHFDLMRLCAAVGQPAAALRQYQQLERVLQAELGEAPSARTRALAEEVRRDARVLVVAPSAPPRLPAPSDRVQPQRRGRSALARAAASDRDGGRAPGRDTGGGGGRSDSRQLAGRSDPPPTPSLCPSVSSVANILGLGQQPRVPVQFTRFFGRDEEVTRIAETLCFPETHLVTLTGPGGSGKTRLAIAASGRLEEALDGAIIFVPVADLTDARHIPDAIATALGLLASRESELMEQVTIALRSRPWLLILDNFEHLVSEGALLVRSLLERAPSLTCLVTSRQRLNLAGEQEFPVLPLPTPRASDPPERLLQYASVQLFLDRARAVRPEFQVTAANAAAVAMLCDRLDGLPLALELAAARVQVVTPAQMLAYLEREHHPSGGLDFLVTGQRDVPARHRSLMAAIEGSYRLLSPELQRFFRQLSVFRGGWSLEAAEAVCGEVMSDECRVMSESRPSVLDCLEQLRECSLIVAEEVQLPKAPSHSSLITHHSSLPDMRYRMLEPVRQYAAEQMRASGEEAAVRERHAAFFLARAEAIEPALLGGQQTDCYEQLEREHDNLRAALAWCKGTPDGAEMGLRLAGASWRFWDARCYTAEGRQHLADLLARPEAQYRTAPRAKALYGAGVLSESASEIGPARRYHEECLAIRRELGDQRGIAESLGRLGGILVEWFHQPEESRLRFQESLAIYRQLGDRQGIAETLSGLASLAWRHHDYATARTLYHEALEITRALGNRLREEAIFSMLGMMAFDDGALGTARSHFEEGLAIAQAFGARRPIAVSSYFLGQIAFRQGDYASARRYWEECRRIDAENQTKAGAVLGSLADLAIMEGDYEAAHALWEQSLAEAREIRVPDHIAVALRGLADVARRQRDDDKAVSLYAESLRIQVEVGCRQGSAECLDGMAKMAVRQGQPARAARLLGAMEPVREAGALGPIWEALERAEHDQTVESTRAVLGEEAFTAAWSEGRAMTLPQAIAYALVDPGSCPTETAQ